MFRPFEALLLLSVIALVLPEFYQNEAIKLFDQYVIIECNEISRRHVLLFAWASLYLTYAFHSLPTYLLAATASASFVPAVSALIDRYPHTNIKHWSYLCDYEDHFRFASLILLCFYFISLFKYPGNKFPRVAGPFGVSFIDDPETGTRIYYPVPRSSKNVPIARAVIVSKRRPQIVTAAFFHLDGQQVKMVPMTPGSFPLIVLASDKKMMWFAQDLASRGFVVAEVDGSGTENMDSFISRLVENINAACLGETQGKLELLKGGVDLGRIAAIGFGRGANAVMNAAARDRRIKAIVSIEAILSDLPTWTVERGVPAPLLLIQSNMRLSESYYHMLRRIISNTPCSYFFTSRLNDQFSDAYIFASTFLKKSTPLRPYLMEFLDKYIVSGTEVSRRLSWIKSDSRRMSSCSVLSRQSLHILDNDDFPETARVSDTDYLDGKKANAGIEFVTLNRD